ncbi:hypothetical protein ACE6ED_21580 [Paenibacillus sp. CN-4]
MGKQKQKVQENYQTPNEKYNAEFAVENGPSAASQPGTGGTAKPVQKTQQ